MRHRKTSSTIRRALLRPPVPPVCRYILWYRVYACACIVESTYGAQNVNYISLPSVLGMCMWDVLYIHVYVKFSHVYIGVRHSPHLSVPIYRRVGVISAHVRTYVRGYVHVCARMWVCVCVCVCFFMSKCDDVSTRTYNICITLHTHMHAMYMRVCVCVCVWVLETHRRQQPST